MVKLTPLRGLRRGKMHDDVVWSLVDEYDMKELFIMCG